MKTSKKFTWVTLLLALSLLLAACGTLDMGVETPLASGAVVEEIDPGAGDVETPAITEQITPPTPSPLPTAESTPELGSSQYWVQGADPRTGVRFALPCFWEYEITPDESGSLSAFSLRNYPYSFAESFPRGVGVFESGGIKFDVLNFKYADWGVPDGSTPRQLVESMYANNMETTLTSIEERVYNNQPVLRVLTESTFGTGISYWYDLSPETVLVLGIVPTEADALEDVQAILSSIALTPDVSVQMPLIPPANPPQGVQADCLAEVEHPVEPGGLNGMFDCATTDYASLDYAACNVVDSFRSGNTAALISWMGDPFILGYWASEYNPVEPAYAVETLRQNHLPQDTSKLTFTSERAKFPPLEGMPPEDILGPDVNIAEIIYSEGWGQDGSGSALLYIAQDGAGKYYFYGMLVSFTHFDK